MAIEEKRSYSLDQWRIAYKKYGGSARLLLNETDSSIERKIARAINDLRSSDLDFLLKPHLHDFQALSNVLVQVDPLVDETGTVIRCDCRGRVISPYILNKLMAAYRVKLADVLQKTSTILITDVQTKGGMGIFYEDAGHRYLNGLKSITVRSLNDPLRFLNINLFHDGTLSDYHDHPLELEPGRYYRLFSRTFPGVDSFVIMG